MKLSQAGVAALAALMLLAPARTQDTKVQDKGVRVPYTLTMTSHILVRAKINGKGPYNFILDTGAPALFVATGVAEKIGLEVKNKWAKVDELEIEGGLKLKAIDARIDDPYQLTGMNALGLPGAELHGVLGYNVAAHYRITFNAKRRHMRWTKLDWKVPKPPGAKEIFGEEKPPQTQDQLMKMLAGLLKMLGRRGGEPPAPRGTFGIEIELEDGFVTVAAVHDDSPADDAGLQRGDILIRFAGQKVRSLKALMQRVNTIEAGTEVEITIERDGKERELKLRAAAGL